MILESFFLCKNKEQSDFSRFSKYEKSIYWFTNRKSYDKMYISGEFSCLPLCKIHKLN